MSAAPLFCLRYSVKIMELRENLHMIGDNFLSSDTCGWGRPRRLATVPEERRNEYCRRIAINRST
jgi:hypothetical protein